MAWGPKIKSDSFGADLANALLLRPVYRKPAPKEPVKSAGKSGFTERALERLTAIRVRVDFTTPGKWYVAEEVDGVYAGKRTVVKYDNESGDTNYRSRIVTVGQTRPHEWKNADNNVKFIAHAPDDMRLLMSIIGKMQSEAWFNAEHGDGRFAEAFMRICDEAVRDEGR